MRHVWEIEASCLVIRVYRGDVELMEFQAMTHGGWVDCKTRALYEAKSDVLKHIKTVAKNYDCEVSV